jgi:hypothetical protein
MILRYYKAPYHTTWFRYEAVKLANFTRAVYSVQLSERKAVGQNCAEETDRHVQMDS